MRRRGLWMDYIYVRKGTGGWGETNSQVAPLCAVLEDPETPVLTEIRDLILRIVIRTETVFNGQTHVLQTELVDNVLRVGVFNKMTI